MFSEELKPKLIEALVSKYSFDLPDMIVEQEIDLMFRGKVSAMSEDEVSALRVAEDAVKELREMRADAEKV